MILYVIISILIGLIIGSCAKKIFTFIKFIFRSPFLGNKYITCEDIASDISELKLGLSKTILTLSTGTVILTFTVIQFIVKNCSLLDNILFLRLGWALLLISILSSILFADYLVGHLILIRKIEKYKDDKIFMNDMYASWKAHMWLELIQHYSFVIALILISIFTFYNIR